MTAATATGSPVSALVQNGTKGRFCASRSANQVLSNPVEVSSNDRNRIGALLAGTISVQNQAILRATANLVRDLGRKFPDTASLHSLSINQTNTLLSLSDNQLSELSDLNLCELGALASLSSQQVKKALKEHSPASIRTLPLVELKELEPLQSRQVNGENLAKLQDENYRGLASHLQKFLEQQQAPVNYVVYGSVKSIDVASNRCLAHVIAGENICPLYRDKFPNYAYPFCT